MRRFVRDNALSLFFFALMLLAVIGQAFSGHAEYNHEQVTEGHATVSMAAYLTGSDFAVDVAENWQSEFLAIASMTVLAIYLRQRGSPESKPVGAAHSETGIEG